MDGADPQRVARLGRDGARAELGAGAVHVDDPLRRERRVEHIGDAQDRNCKFIPRRDDPTQTLEEQQRYYYPPATNATKHRIS